MKEKILFWIFKRIYQLLYSISFFYLIDIILNENWYKGIKKNYVSIDNDVFL